MTEMGQFAMFLAVAAGAIGLFFGPIGRAVGRLIEGSRRGGDPVVQELRARLEQLETERGRIADLEERVDFAERLLAQHREPDQIGG
jgi:hypothetical protein